jgi:uncharacterized protein
MEFIDMDREMIAKTESFLKETFASSSFLMENPAEAAYRLEHSYRVANIAKTIAETEGFDVTEAVVAGLLHDIAYCEEMTTQEDRRNHGRRGAEIVRPFLVSLGFPQDKVNAICYGIAIHVDDTASFELERTPFTETVGDADNIDRFDVYRIYEILQIQKFSEMTLEQKENRVNTALGRLNNLLEMKMATSTAQRLWTERLEYYISFYRKLEEQLANSGEILS